MHYRESPSGIANRIKLTAAYRWSEYRERKTHLKSDKLPSIEGTYNWKYLTSESCQFSIDWIKNCNGVPISSIIYFISKSMIDGHVQSIGYIKGEIQNQISPCWDLLRERRCLVKSFSPAGRATAISELSCISITFRAGYNRNIGCYVYSGGSWFNSQFLEWQCSKFCRTSQLFKISARMMEPKGIESGQFSS
jgi:hypothetical protein